jgi:tRNA G46 methylase TrmB
MQRGKYHIELRKASDLFNSKTTTSGIEAGFEKGEMSMFYHSYNPEKAFIAVPPELLRELADKANDQGLVVEIDNGLKNANNEKQIIIEDLKKQYQMRVSKKE